MSFLRYFFSFFPQAVHLVFSKNCFTWQRGLEHTIMRSPPQRSQRSCTNVGWLQCGHWMRSGRPQPAHMRSSFLTGLRQLGQRYKKGLALAQLGQKRASRSTSAPQWMQGTL